MTYVLMVNPDGTTTIQVDFADEGVNLQGDTVVKGDEAEAVRYLPVFEADLRLNYSDMFPIPEVPEGGVEL
jgi:hypothetical protein